jgi:AcrR family transcriptional regulator
MPVRARKPSHTEPVQERSRRTLERIVRATEQLLETKSFDDIGVDDIARRARCSTGSFYARFKGKDALLPYLYERYDAELRPRIAARMKSIDWKSLSLRQTCDLITGGTVDMYAERRHLLRAMALFARSQPKSIGDATRDQRVGLHDGFAALLTPHLRDLSADVALERSRTGLFIVMAAARDKILFGDAPHASATPLSLDHLKSELSRALFGYLTCI